MDFLTFQKKVVNSHNSELNIKEDLCHRMGLFLQYFPEIDWKC